jgi:hypothetical protein
MQYMCVFVNQHCPFAKLEVLTADTTNIYLFWVMTSCIVIDMYRHFDESWLSIRGEIFLKNVCIYPHCYKIYY